MVILVSGANKKIIMINNCKNIVQNDDIPAPNGRANNIISSYNNYSSCLVNDPNNICEYSDINYINRNNFDVLLHVLLHVVLFAIVNCLCVCHFNI